MHTTNISGTIAACLAVFLIGAGLAPSLMSMTSLVGDSLVAVADSTLAASAYKEPNLSPDQLTEILRTNPDLMKEVQKMVFRRGLLIPKISSVKPSRAIGDYEVWGKNLVGSSVYLDGHKIPSRYTVDNKGRGTLVFSRHLSAGTHKVYLKNHYSRSKEKSFKVKGTSSANGSSNAESIRVVSPNREEIWSIFSQGTPKNLMDEYEQTIRWEAENIRSSVVINLVTEGGLVCTLGSAGASSGRFTFVPRHDSCKKGDIGELNADSFYVEVKAGDVSDYSDEPITLSNKG